MFQNSSTSNNKISWDAILDGDQKWTRKINLSFFCTFIQFSLKNFTEDSDYS